MSAKQFLWLGFLFPRFLSIFAHLIFSLYHSMKKRIFFAIGMVLLALTVSADPITPQQALALAMQFTPDGNPPVLCREGHARKAAAKTPPYYIFSRGKGKGYVIVAGDDCIPSVIGYTEKGDFDESREAPQLLAMLRSYAEAVETRQAAGTNTPYLQGKNRVSGEAPARINIPEILTSHWHQASPYNDKVPVLSNGERAAAGCVAIAGGQVFYHWRREMPSTLPATTPTYDFGEAPVTVEYQIKRGTPLKWDLMCDSYSSQPAEYREAVATFVAALGMQTWMEYGPSSGAYIWKIPYDEYNLQARQANKDDGYTDDKWSALIYSDLLKGQPLVYSGYKENWEGHALVIDGYKANGDLFHFNFGWGGQSDGYYTVAESGVKNVEFAMSPTVMYDIHPKSYKLEAEIQLPPVVYSKCTNDITVEVTNKSSVPLSGVYLFATTNDKAPDNLASAVASDTETTIGVDQTVPIELATRFTSTATWYLKVTDANLNVLASKEVTPADHKAVLWVDDIKSNGSTVRETHGGTPYTVVYHDGTSVTASFRNTGATGYEGAVRLRIQRSNDEGATWQLVGNKAATLNVAAGETVELNVAVTNTSSTPIVSDVLYRAFILNPIPNTKDYLHYAEGTDSIAYFILKSGDLDVESFDNNILKLKGNWDYERFLTILRNTVKYQSADGYDLTAVNHVAGVPVLDSNPNALFYVADDCEAEGVNVVSGGHSRLLHLKPGFNFAPQTPFQAGDAAMTIDGPVAKWQILTAPFDVQLPDGMVGRRIDGHTTNGITGKTTDVAALEAGAAYLVMTTSESNRTLAGSGVGVAVSPNGNAELVGTYSSVVAPAGAMTVNDADEQYFVFMADSTVVAPFSGYFLAEDVTRTFTANSNPMTDPAYQELAGTISDARRTLRKYRDMVTEEMYENYLAAIMEAEHLFTHREENGLDTSVKIRNYAGQLAEKGNEYSRNVVFLGNAEVDVSSVIRNPSFEMKSTTGWTLTQPLNSAISASQAARVYANSSYNYKTVGADGGYVLNNSYVYVDETTGRDTLGVGISQLLTGLKPGTYRLSAMLASDEGNTITLFAGDRSTEVTAHDFGRHYFRQAVVDSIKVDAAADGTTGELLIGVKPGKWYKADHFRLTMVEILDGASGDGVTEITVSEQPVRQGIYTLQGHRISRITTPGLYIIDGRKTVVRTPRQ